MNFFCLFVYVCVSMAYTVQIDTCVHTDECSTVATVLSLTFYKPTVAILIGLGCHKAALFHQVTAVAAALKAVFIFMSAAYGVLKHNTSIGIR